MSKIKTHHFLVEDAKKHGIYKAILLEHLRFHQEANQGNPDLTFKGKTFAFIKKSTIENMYSYLNYDSVRKWLKELEDDGIIESIKPHSKRGYHLKYYHVKSIGIKSQSNETEVHSMNGMRSHSSILPIDNITNGITDSVDSSREFPSIKLFLDFAVSKGIEIFYAFKVYERWLSNDWMIGDDHIKNWKGALIDHHEKYWEGEGGINENNWGEDKKLMFNAYCHETESLRRLYDKGQFDEIKKRLSIPDKISRRSFNKSLNN